MKEGDILGLPSVPHISPAYPRGPYRFRNREYFIVAYETERASLLQMVPQPLVPNARNLVLYEWIGMPDSSGFGDYQESGVVIPCVLPDGQEVNYVAEMYLDCEPPIACGREIWGFPKKRGYPSLRVDSDTLVGSLQYASQTVAVGSMAYKYEVVPDADAAKSLTKLNACLKVIPGLGGKPAIAQLIGYNLCDVEVLGAWRGPARLHLLSSVGAPVDLLPVRRVVEGKHIIANLTLPFGRVLHDYLSPEASHQQLPAQITAEEEEANRRVFFTPDEVRSVAAMPAVAPSFPGASHPVLTTHQGVLILYETEDLSLILPHLPEDLELVSPTLYFQIGEMEGIGVGAYNRSQLCVLVKRSAGAAEGEKFFYPLLCLANCSACITYGREKYGKPFKYGVSQLKVDKDTLAISVKYGSQEVVRGSMLFKHNRVPEQELQDILSTPELFLKFIPSSEGSGPELCQLVTSNNINVNVDDVYQGSAALTFAPHVHAPFADLPIKRIITAFHYTSTSTQLPAAILKDFLKK